ncbi:integrase [Rhizobium sp. Root708]|nr:integrase [Rhizobium sp. Root708]
MPKKHLTQNWLKDAPKAPKGKRVVYSDNTEKLCVRVNDEGEATFIFVARLPGKIHPAPQTLGKFNAQSSDDELRLRSEGKPLPRPPVAMSLARARELAEEWSSLLKRGINPVEYEKRLANDRQKAARHTFASVVEDYLADIPTRKRNRHVEQDAREIRRELLERKDKDDNVIWQNTWAAKKISDVTDADIAQLVGAIRDRPAPGMAYNVWGHIKAIFSWAMWPERRQGYELSINPTAHLQPKHFKLSKTVSTRVFSDDEIRAYWAAAEATPYPLGDFYKLLMLTGQRKAEVSDMERSEVSHNRRLWTVPDERFKSGQSHIVPLSDDAIELIDSLPRFEGKDSGQCLFSTTLGVKPINGFSRAKGALDKAMLAELRKADPDATLPDWVFHDVRRTVRTRLSGLRINADVAEMVIGHGKTGLRRVYDQYEFEPEMREALDRWAVALKNIVAPTAPDNVINFDRNTA